MKFQLTDRNNEIRTIRVLDENNIDSFYDLEVNFPLDHERNDETDAYLCTETEYNELLDYWTAEVKAMREGGMGFDEDYSEHPYNVSLVEF